MRYSHRNGETEPPTETGYYWFRYNVKTEQLCHICQVRRRVHSGLYAVWPGVDFQEDVDELAGRWYGPILEPEQVVDEVWKRNLGTVLRALEDK